MKRIFTLPFSVFLLFSLALHGATESRTGPASMLRAIVTP